MSPAPGGPAAGYRTIVTSVRGDGPVPGYWTVRLRSTNVRTRSPTAKGGVGLRGRGGRAGSVVDRVVVLDRVATVDRAAVRDREDVELDPPHPASATATATLHAATPRTRDLNDEHAAVVGCDIALR